MNGRKGLIFDIQGFSVHDGPGSRTAVFMSGCPLRCQWCANPEGMRPRPVLLYSGQRCRYHNGHCRRCLRACPHGAVEETGALPSQGAPLRFRFERCAACQGHDCVEACCHDAARLSGEYKSAEEVLGVLRRDRQYWSEDGGATFTGGEPLTQHEFLTDVLEALKGEGVHRAIETSAHAPTDAFLRVMGLVDFAFVDLKHMDSAAHREKTGVGNELILGNIRALRESGWGGRLIFRTPVIRGFNDSLENASQTMDFMDSIGCFEINLLPFHRLAASKWEQMGESYLHQDEEPTQASVLDRLQDCYLERGIACYAGDDVMY